MGSIIVAEYHISVRALVVIRIHENVNILLNVHKLPKVQQRTVQKIDAASDEADARAALVIVDTRRMNDDSSLEDCFELVKIVLDQFN